MVTEERQKFPFDIQHRHVITYKTDSKSDYETLEKEIKNRLLALIGKQKSVKELLFNPVKESQGLKPHELTMLIMIMENQLTSEDSVSAYSLKSDMEKAGYNSLAVSVAIRELQRKGYIRSSFESDYNNNEYIACRLTESGENWILDNQENLEFKKTTANEQYNNLSDPDDFPF